MLPAIDFVDMNDAERDAFIDESFEEYRDRMVHLGRWTPDNSEQRVESIKQSAPQDRHAAGQRFYRIVSAGTEIGALWLQYDGDVLFVMQITIAPALRRAGWGRAVMAEVERRARLQGARRLALNVFFDNDAALHLYETEGYTGILQQMVKRLD